MNLRSYLYRAARALGDVSAARNGPAAFGRRVARRRAYRATGRATSRLLRKGGLL